MQFSVFSLLLILGILLYFIVLQFFILFFNKYQNEILHKKSEKYFINNINHLHITGSQIERLLFQNYKSLHQFIVFDNIVKEKIFNSTLISVLEKEYTKKMKSFSTITRITSSIMLGMLGSEISRKTLEERLLLEKSNHVILYIANSIAEMRNPESLRLLVPLLNNKSSFFRAKLNTLICEYGIKFYEYFEENIHDFTNFESIDLVIEFSHSYYSELLRNFLFSIANNSLTILKPTSYQEIEYLREKALFILSEYYFDDLILTDKLNHSEPLVKKALSNALANKCNEDSLDTLISFLFDENIRSSAINAILKILERKPVFLNKIIAEFFAVNSLSIRNYITIILSQKLDYFVFKLDESGMTSFDEIVRECIINGRLSNIIAILNNNNDIEIENRILKVLNNSVQQKPEIYPALYKNLNPKSLSKVTTPESFEYVEKAKEKQEKSFVKSTLFMLIIPFLLVPILYCSTKYYFIIQSPIKTILKDFVVTFNYYLAFYSITVNLSFLILLVFSLIGSRKQIKLWQVKKLSFLFKKNFLPTVSIIAPAFNEDKTIIESTNSLLALKYPDFELIIVNDGSSDNTLKRLNEFYGLQISNHSYDNLINCMPIRGIYSSKSFPKLIVVDKENGGKADSLNAGINLSSKEYFCGIDADSILETDSLIKLASIALDEEFEVPAIGGNVFPANGCSVSDGHLSHVSIPKNNLAKLQMMEYIRSFMGGRVGWASLDSLLIISGAFGLFRKERIVEIGGYLTKSGQYKQDTVGEDMELVVRISRKLRELKQHFKIAYAFNANCWTEVPEDLKSLYKQRTRWHRGLIEILYFHKKLLFNPRYGRMGMFSLPYFLIFEVVGPVFEFQGYIMVFLALVFGLMNFQIAILLFIGSVLLGVLISISSLNISQKNFSYFSYKDTFKLLFVSIVENFGPRQLMSFWRLGGAIKILRGETGWGKLERKGFSNNN